MRVVWKSSTSLMGGCKVLSRRFLGKGSLFIFSDSGIFLSECRGINQMILLKAFFLKGVVACAGVAPEFVTVHVCSYIHTHTHTAMCTQKEQYKPDLGEPRCWQTPQLTEKSQMACHNNIALPSCHFTREELKHRNAHDSPRSKWIRGWVIGPAWCQVL